MILDVFDGLLVIRGFDILVPIVVAEVTRVEHIVAHRVEMAREGLHVMRPDEPLLVLNTHAILNILEVIVGRQVQLVACRDVVVHELRSVLDQSKPFVWVILLSCFDVDEVLLDISSLQGQFLLLLIYLLLCFVIA